MARRTSQAWVKAIHHRGNSLIRQLAHTALLDLEASRIVV
jgi:hypothetical protein